MVKGTVVKLICFALVLCLLCLSNLRAQDPEHKGQRPRQVFPTRVQEPEEVLRIDTDLVAVDCTVTDSTGRLIKNLQKQDFKLYADGREQPLSFFQVEQRTVCLGDARARREPHQLHLRASGCPRDRAIGRSKIDSDCWV